ncbi:L,D-transpeptidase family protein [Isoptericola sp. QY 916]|nr:L,D-transpeptidase family protein [Isoptericola sp. QY 916]
MLEYGDSGERVVALQERLQELGYFIQEADGSFGPATQQAVWALQKAAGQYRDGVVGPKTQAALDDGVRPQAHSSSGKAIEIDLDRQLLMTVEGGKVTRIINASSGNGETYEAKGRSYHATTPRGSYAVYMERNGMHESTLELGSMYRPKYFSGGYAVHGSGSIPPYPASHGCVRVSNAAMNWLWDSWGMPKGTPVILY